MKLIVEDIEELEVLTEEKEGKKSLFIRGKFLQANRVNKNKRYYHVETLQREVDRYNQQYVKEGRALGELGHPDGPSINLDRVSHKIVELYREGNDFIGKAKILESTPMGKIASALINEGVSLGVSSRGIGTLDQREGINYVKDDFMLATAADIVADPSAPEAFVQGIMEGKEWVYDGSRLKEIKVEATQRQINSAVKERRLQERKLAIFEQFLNSL